MGTNNACSREGPDHHVCFHRVLSGNQQGNIKTGSKYQIHTFGLILKSVGSTLVCDDHGRFHGQYMVVVIVADVVIIIFTK